MLNARWRNSNPCRITARFSRTQSLRCIYRDAGHILGSAIIEAWISEGGQTRKGVFSGDIGQPARPLVRDPTPVAEADFLLVESTYGNRLHRSMEATLDELQHAITDTLQRKKGNVIVPAFAVGRAQEMLYLLADLHHKGRLPAMKIYVDSPMAMKATEITLRHMAILDPDTAEVMNWTKKQHDGMQVNFVQDVEESMALEKIKHGAIIISASGMCDAGRIKHHLQAESRAQAKHGADHRLSGRGHHGPADCGWRKRGAHFRRAGTGARRHLHHRRPVGAR